MITLDNINENINNKINDIDKIIDILYNVYNINEIEQNLYNSIHYKPQFYKNTHNLIIKIENIKDKINFYLVGISMLLTEYHDIIENNDNFLSNDKIYNNSTFILNNNLKNILSSSDLLELKDIYYNNFYIYKNFKYPSAKKIKKKISTKDIYNKFNIFISVNNIYDTFDNFIDFVKSYLSIYEKEIHKYIIDSDNLNFEKIKLLENAHNQLHKHINNFNKIKLSYELDEINYDICECSNRMIVQPNTSELICIKCGAVQMLLGSVIEDIHFFSQEGNRYRHGSYDPSRHCKFWIERIQAKENTYINPDSIAKIEKCIKRDKITNLKNISIKQFRLYLKQTNLSRLNDHIPLIKKIITGYIPPQLTYGELHTLFNYFDKATKTYEIIKPSGKKNSLYYPFLIYKILELIISDIEKREGLLNCIHLQSYETLIDNDKIWKEICKSNDCFEYKPTNKCSYN